MFVTNWISTTKIQKISEITNFFRHYFLSRTEVNQYLKNRMIIKQKRLPKKMEVFFRIVTRMGLEPMTPTLKVLCSTS